MKNINQTPLSKVDRRDFLKNDLRGGNRIDTWFSYKLFPAI